MDDSIWRRLIRMLIWAGKILILGTVLYVVGLVVGYAISGHHNPLRIFSRQTWDAIRAFWETGS